MPFHQEHQSSRLLQLSQMIMVLHLPVVHVGKFYQTLAGDIDCVMMDSKERFKILKLNSLLPFAFTGKTLKRPIKMKK